MGYIKDKLYQSHMYVYATNIFSYLKCLDDCVKNESIIRESTIVADRITGDNQET